MLFLEIYLDFYFLFECFGFVCFGGCGYRSKLSRIWRICFRSFFSVFRRDWDVGRERLVFFYFIENKRGLWRGCRLFTVI